MTDDVPLSEVAWEVWYWDTFDRECPPQVEVKGRGLAAGLLELWGRYLFETVRPSGSKGFSHFNLQWQGTQTEIKGNWKGATRLREWVFGAAEYTRKGYLDEGDTRLLEKVAVAHANLVAAGRTGEQILAAAAVSVDRVDFESRLVELPKR